jgi:hypothetical protein
MAFHLAIRNALKLPFNPKKISSWEEMFSILFKKVSTIIYENS